MPHLPRFVNVIPWVTHVRHVTTSELRRAFDADEHAEGFVVRVLGAESFPRAEVLVRGASTLLLEQPLPDGLTLVVVTGDEVLAATLDLPEA